MMMHCCVSSGLPYSSTLPTMGILWSTRISHIILIKSSSWRNFKTWCFHKGHPIRPDFICCSIGKLPFFHPLLLQVAISSLMNFVKEDLIVPSSCIANACETFSHQSLFAKSTSLSIFMRHCPLWPFGRIWFLERFRHFPMHFKHYKFAVFHNFRHIWSIPFRNRISGLSELKRSIASCHVIIPGLQRETSSQDPLNI